MGRDFSRFSLSSNVTRLARLMKGGVAERERENGGGRGRRGRLVSQMVGLLVRLPGMVRGLSHLSEHSSGPEPTGQQKSQPAGLIRRDLIIQTEWLGRAVLTHGVMRYETLSTCTYFPMSLGSVCKDTSLSAKWASARS